MEDLSKKSLMFVDNGLFTEMASRLSRKGFGKVYYHCSQGGPFPSMKRAFLGHGFEGVELVESIWDIPMEDVDCYAFPDIGWGATQEHLVSLGARVWGARRGDELENERVAMKALLKKLGLPVGPFEVIKGMEALRKFLGANPDQFVKLSKYRKDWESLGVNDYEELKPKLDELANEMGPFQDIAEFVVEAALPDCVELGEDMFTIDGAYPAMIDAGVEIKDMGYGARFVRRDSLPEPLTRVSTLLSQIFKSYQYRGFFSSEVRIGKDHKPYFIDACCRCGSPPSELYQEHFLNLPQIIWEGAGGKVIDPEVKKVFGAQIILHSTWTDTHFQPVAFPEDLREHIKLVNPVKIEGKYYVVPQCEGMETIGSAIGFGNTMDEAIEEATEVSKSVRGYGIDVPTDALSKMQEQLDKAEEMGLKLF